MNHTSTNLPDPSTSFSSVLVGCLIQWWDKIIVTRAKSKKKEKEEKEKKKKRS